MLVTVMGVSGSGKTTVGAALAQRLRVPFADADDLHPPANVAKMSAGIPLDDAGRLAGRPGHFMPAALVDSQFATLEPLDPDERGVTLDVDQPIDALVAACVAALGVQGATS